MRAMCCAMPHDGCSTTEEPHKNAARHSLTRAVSLCRQDLFRDQRHEHQTHRGSGAQLRDGGDCIVQKPLHRLSSRRTAALTGAVRRASHPVEAKRQPRPKPDPDERVGQKFASGSSIASASFPTAMPCCGVHPRPKNENFSSIRAARSENRLALRLESALCSSHDCQRRLY